jgi:hypothetical protein
MPSPYMGECSGCGAMMLVKYTYDGEEYESVLDAEKFCAQAVATRGVLQLGAADRHAGRARRSPATQFNRRSDALAHGLEAVEPSLRRGGRGCALAGTGAFECLAWTALAGLRMR